MKPIKWQLESIKDIFKKSLDQIEDINGGITASTIPAIKVAIDGIEMCSTAMRKILVEVEAEVAESERVSIPVMFRIGSNETPFERVSIKSLTDSDVESLIALLQRQLSDRKRDNVTMAQETNRG